MKKTIAEKLNEQKIHIPGLAYDLLARILKPIMMKKYGVKIIDKVEGGMKNVKEQHIFISTHTSRIDYFYNAFHLYPNKYNFLVGYNEFYRKQFIFLAKLMQLIPKRNFTPDFNAIKQSSRIIKDGGNLALFPEGMNSITGYNQPIALGTGKMLKHYKLPVYCTTINGGFLTTPKYALDERHGTIEVTYEKLFTKEDLEKYSIEEIEDIINKKFTHDDFAWNKEKHYKYDNKGRAADNMHTLLYRCPKCGKEFSMEGKGDVIKCLACGNGARLDEEYNLIPLSEDCVIPQTISDWSRQERSCVKEEVKKENFKFEVNVKLGMLPKYEYIKGSETSKIVGEGLFTLDRTGITYDGLKDGEKFKFHIDSSMVPTYGMCTDISRFYTFLNGEFVEFYPEYPCVEKIVMATEEIHRLNGGKWKSLD